MVDAIYAEMKNICILKEKDTKFYQLLDANLYLNADIEINLNINMNI